MDLVDILVVAVLAENSNAKEYYFMEDLTMKNLFAALFVIIIVVIVIFFDYCLSSYNEMVELFENVNFQYSQIETNLQRRIDLIPNFVEVVKGYAAHEETVFTEIAEARAKLAGCMNSQNVDEISEANSTLDNALSRLLVISENYPELQASEHFTALQDELAGTENRIAVSRQYYNEAVQQYNKTIKQFPAVIFTTIAGYKPLEYFEASTGADVAPTINFD